MLRNVLGDYLDSLTERQLDLPLLLLLPAMGYFDIHLTHGSVEFGKDIIAKKNERGQSIQYVFQSKAGDINQGTWRNDIQGQILEAVLTSLSHPNFDASGSHQVVLVTTGDMKGNAALGLQELNRKIVDIYHRRPIDFWGRSNLIDHFSEFGLSGLLHSTAADFEEHGRFFVLYGEAMQGVVTERTIERHSRQWLSGTSELDRRLLRAAIESEALAHQCMSQGRHYEAIHAILALLRTLCEVQYIEPDTAVTNAFDAAASRLHVTCMTYIDASRIAWEAHRDLIRSHRADFVTYLVHCARIMEAVSLAYFSTKEESVRTDLSSFLEDFVRTEPGCGHPLSDRYTVSLVMSVLALTSSRREELTPDLIRRATVWLCDRYEEGMGIAPLEADEHDEVRTFLGYPFDFIELQPPSACLMATALGDLAALLGKKSLYGDILNDMKACGIHGEYWQAFDTSGVCRIEAADVHHYPSVQFDEHATDFQQYNYADHIRHECQSFQFIERFGVESSVFLMTLLRDRYFPRLWPRLIASSP